MDKIAEAEVLVDMILEQGFSVNVALSNLKGNSDVDWTECYNRRCRTEKDEYKRRECKLRCEWGAYNLLVTRINALRGRCRQAQNPDACLRRLQQEADMIREKQRKTRTAMEEIRRAAAEQARQQSRQRGETAAETPR